MVSRTLDCGNVVNLKIFVKFDRDKFFINFCICQHKENVKQLTTN